MKTVFVLLFFFVLTGNSEAQLKKFETAVAYNDYMIAEQVKIGKMIRDFNNTFSALADTHAIHKARMAIKAQADSSIKLVKLMQPYKGDTALKKATISLFDFYAKAAANEYAVLISIFSSSKLSKEEKRKQLELIIKTITDTEAVVDKNFADAQKAFAAKHGFTLTENDFKINE